MLSSGNPPSDPVPPGFERHTRRSPLTDPWEPLYARRTDRAVILGVRVGDAHLNGRGLAHGGFLSALADNAMGLSCLSQMSTPHSLLTVSLAVDFLGVARVGQWLEFDTVFTRIGATLCFAQAFVTADGAVCARANASFRALPK